MLVSVVLLPGPLGNIERTLRSIARQLPPTQLELLTSVPVSKHQQIRTQVEHFTRIRQISGHNPDVSNCSGEWIAFIKAGDEWPSNRLRDAIKASQDADVLYSDAFLTWQGTSTGRRVAEYLRTDLPTDPRTLADQYSCLFGSTVIVRRQAWLSAGRSRHNGAGWEIEQWLRFIAAGLRFRLLDSPLPYTPYPPASNESIRFQYLKGTVAGFREVVKRQEGTIVGDIGRRYVEVLNQTLIVSRYRDLLRKERLSLVALPEVHRSPKRLCAQLAATIAPKLFTRIHPGLKDYRPDLPVLDPLSRWRLHDCSGRANSLCRRQPLVSVIIPCFNYGQYLRAAIESALNQDYPFIEVIVINDGSTDDTANIASAFDSQIRYVDQENQGLSQTRNTGSRIAKGEFLLFLDADDQLHPLCVRELLGAFCNSQGDSKLGFVYSQVRHFGSESNVSEYPMFDPAKLSHHNYIHSAALMRAEVFRDALYDPTFEGLEDWDFYLSLVGAGWTGVLVDLPLLFYRSHSDGRNKSAQMYQTGRASEIIAQIHMRHSSSTTEHR